MADDKKQLTPEEKKEEELKKKREKKEEAEIKKKHNQKAKQKKLRDARLKKKKQKEQKRIDGIINSPFKILFQISLFITSISFVIIFFGLEEKIIETVYYSFLIFTLLYLSGGIVLIGVAYMVSEEKLAEIEEQLRMEEEKLELARQQESDVLEQMIESEKLTNNNNNTDNEHQTQMFDDGMEPELPSDLSGINESIPENKDEGYDADLFQEIENEGSAGQPQTGTSDIELSVEGELNSDGSELTKSGKIDITEVVE